MSDRTLLPGATIGILGGGQLGRMVALEARRMGYRTVTLDPTPNSPCGQVADEQIVADFTDVEAALRLADKSDVVIYEFEDVDDKVVEAIERRVYVPQGSRLLSTTRHRLREKNDLQQAGIPVAKHLGVRSLDDLIRAHKVIGRPFIVKTTTGGYDGKGQWRVTEDMDLQALWQTMQSGLPKGAMTSGEDAVGVPASPENLPITSGEAALQKIPFVVEEEVSFQCEVSVVVARSKNGETRPFPVAENIHQEHVLQFSICPARIDEEVANQALALAVQAAQALDVVGLLGVEMFLRNDGNLLVNELAPRPHNSGHYTQDACVTSQFEQLIRSVTGLPLGSSELLTPVVMSNILGEHLEGVMSTLETWPDTFKLHLYGKAESRTKRKMGHVNVLAHTTNEAMRLLDQIGIFGVCSLDSTSVR